jgi:hypothetical protein
MPTTYPIATTEQTTNDVIVFDQEGDWAEAASVVWRWSAPGGSGTPWYNLSDVRLRSTKAYGTVVLVAASGGRTAMLRKSTRQILWQVSTPEDNPHAIERLPGGVIVTASTKPGRLRFYADSTHTKPFRTVGLALAHGVLYDPARKALWAIGDKQLIRYSLSGKGAGTKLAVHSRVTFKGTGHDLQPVYGEPDALWFTDTYGAYRLDATTNTYEEVDGTHHVKAYISQPTGIRARAKADYAGPRDWGGPTIDFFDADGKKAFSRTRHGAEFYKVRLWTPDFH